MVIRFVSIYVEIRYLRLHFYSYPLMPSMTGAGVLQVMSLKRFALEIRYLRPHFYSYPLMPSMTGAGVLQVSAPKCFA